MSSFKVGDWVKLVNRDAIAKAEALGRSQATSVPFDLVKGIQGVVVDVQGEIGVFLPLLSTQMNVPVAFAEDFITSEEPHPVVSSLWGKVADRILEGQKQLREITATMKQELESKDMLDDTEPVAIPKDNLGLKSVGTVVFDAEGPLYDDGFDEPGENESDDSEPAELFMADTQQQTTGTDPTHEPRRPAVVTDSMRMLDMLHSMRLSATQVAYQMYMQRLSREDDATGDGDTRALRVRLTDEEEQLRNTAASVVRRYLAVNSLKDEDLRIR